MQKEIEKAGIATYLDHDAYNNYIPTLNVILDLKSDDDISSASEDYEHVIKLIIYSKVPHIVNILLSILLYCKIG